MKVLLLEEIFSLHKYEILFIIYIGGFGGKRYLMRNNKIRVEFEDVLFIIFW